MPRIHRLGEVLIESRGIGLVLVAFLPPSSHRNEHHLPPPGLTANARGDFIPAQAGHTDVQEGNVGLDLSGKPESLRSFVSDMNLVTASRT